MKNLVALLAVIIVCISGNLNAATEMEDLRTFSIDISTECADKTTIQQLPVPVPKSEHQMKPFTFRSSRFSRNKKAKESMDYAISGLKENKYNITNISEVFDYNAYVYIIDFVAPDSIKIQRYHNSPNIPYSEIKNQFKKSIEYYKSLGLIILDQNLQRSGFIITVIK
ncbi:MAG: hypothetical protein L6420_02025 [Elusimicrobia bacterium]|nr:hypothetical protein [Elusimicrobiota bacterium]